MPTSIFLAKLIGPIFLAVGIGMFVNAPLYRTLAEEFLRSPALIYLSGLLAMSAGMAIVLIHNVWPADWRVLITILGWLMTIGGAVRIILPQATEMAGRWMLRRPPTMTVAGAIWLGTGAVLSFFGYSR